MRCRVIATEYTLLNLTYAHVSPLIYIKQIKKERLTFLKPLGTNIRFLGFRMNPNCLKNELTRVACLTCFDFMVHKFSLFDLFITKAVVIAHEEPFKLYFPPRRRPGLKSHLTGALDVRCCVKLPGYQQRRDDCFSTSVHEKTHLILSLSPVKPVIKNVYNSSEDTIVWLVTIVTSVLPAVSCPLKSR